MVEFHVEAAEPIPSRYPKEKYPFNALGLMQSFFVPCKNADERRKTQFVLSACARSRKGKKFTTRKVDTPEEYGIRVWRIE